MLHATAHGTVITLSLLLLGICCVHLSRLSGLCSRYGATTDTRPAAFSTLPSLTCRILRRIELVPLYCSRSRFFGFGSLWYSLFLLRPLFIHLGHRRLLFSRYAIISSPHFTSHKRGVFLSLATSEATFHLC